MVILPKKLPPRGRAEKDEERGRELGGVAICPKCKNLHYQKKWYHADSAIPRHLRNAERRKELCPACTIIADHTFEGEVLVDQIPTQHTSEVLNLIRAFGDRAVARDSQDRIIKIEKKKSSYRVTTTENQLAVRLGKKIKEAFRKVDLAIVYAPEPAEVSRVHAVFRREDSTNIREA